MFYNQDTKHLESCYIHNKLTASQIHLQYAKVGWNGENNTITKVTKFSILEWITGNILMNIFINLLDISDQDNSYQLLSQLVQFFVVGGVCLFVFTTLL